jgi:glycosyltransferase involved in cell wall biosynthesis
MPTRKTKISIIIATLNASTCLSRCLDSIIEQTLCPSQVIVQDGQSTDGTIEILHRYEHRLGKVLNWRSEPDQGIADAWNRALSRTDGEWILFLGADDQLASSYSLYKASSILDKTFPGYRIAYGDIAMTASDGRELQIIGQPWTTMRRRFRRSLSCLQHQAIFHHRSFFHSHGRYDTSLRICSDQELLLRGLATEDALYLEDLIVTRMSTGGLSTQRKHVVLINKELLRIQSRHRKVPPWDELYWKLLKAHAIKVLHTIGGERLAKQGVNLYRTLLRGKPELPY